MSSPAAGASAFISLTSLVLVWKAIAPANYHDLGRAVAKDLVARGVKKKKTVNWDKLDLPKQPKAISDEGAYLSSPPLAF